MKSLYIIFKGIIDLNDTCPGELQACMRERFEHITSGFNIFSKLTKKLF